jgi:hypothetical protein
MRSALARIAWVAAVLAARASAQIQFTIEAIQPPGFPSKYAADVDDAGRVACGTHDGLGQAAEAWTWKDGVATALPLPAGMGHFPSVWAIGSTANGGAVGNASIPPTTQFRAIRWNGGAATELPSPTFADAFAYAASSSGIVVGTVYSGFSSQRHACAWSSANAFQVLAAPAGALSTLATAVRADGGIAGYFQTPGSMYGLCSWTPQGQVQIVLAPNAVAVIPCAIAADGTIYGNSHWGSISRPVTVSGGVVTPLPNGGVWGTGHVSDLNASGWAVGLAAGRVDTRATLWIDTVPHDLAALVVDGDGWKLEAATGVSDSGLICGQGTVGGITSGFLLRPRRINASYCTPGTSSNGCAATMSMAGTPSASASSGFELRVSGADAHRSGAIFYGLSGATAVPWGGGTSFLCVKAPTQRTPPASSGGTPGSCDGGWKLDWNEYLSVNPDALGNPRVAGTFVQAQAWHRDPPSPKGGVTSSAVEFVLAP